MMMAGEWMPGAETDRVAGGSMEGQPWRSVVWHTSESGHDQQAIYGVASWVKQQGSEYHLLWNPYHGQFLQLIAASQSARALRNGAGGYRTNRKGTRLIQVCVVGRTADRPLAGGSPLHGWDRLRAWLASHGIPETDRTGNRSTGLWQTSGVHRHADAPGNDHTDPGPIDFGLLYGNRPDVPGEDDDDGSEDDMLIVRSPDGATFLIIGGTRKHGLHKPDDVVGLRDGAGIPLVDVSQKTFDGICSDRH